MAMKKNFRFDGGIISGEIMRDVVEVIPELKTRFTQRKSFDEYYFEETEITINIHDKNGSEVSSSTENIELAGKAEEVAPAAAGIAGQP